MNAAIAMPDDDDESALDEVPEDTMSEDFPGQRLVGTNEIVAGVRVKQPKGRSAVVDALEAAAVRLRDAELGLEAARTGYGEALNAFNRHVAPVPTR